MCRIKCFSVCSIVGLGVLAPTNYTSEGRADIRRSNSMELFTVTNVTRGSNRLALVCIFSLYFHIRGVPFSSSTVSVHIFSNVGQERQVAHCKLLSDYMKWCLVYSDVIQFIM